MKEQEIKKKQIYDSTAKMITSLFFQGKLQEKEMNLLLSFLDLVLIKENESHRELIAGLRTWCTAGHDPESEEIVKNTLLSSDLTEPADRENLLNIIKELS